MVGTGYVGLVSGACFAEQGHHVICVDTNHQKIDDLQAGIIPIHEEGLQDLVDRNRANQQLKFTTSLKDAAREADFIFIAVGTPESESGEANLEYVYSVADELGRVLDDQRYRIIVDKSTVPIGTADEVERRISSLNANTRFDVCSVPEFLKEGSAVQDTLHPDRVIIGTHSAKAQEKLVELHRPYTDQIFVTDIKSAEMIKYASNCFLATKISFINEIANLCELYGANVKDVAQAMGLDKRISPYFLQAGLGYGGSCFPKDVKALIHMATAVNYEPHLLKAVHKVNAEQKKRVILHLERIFNGDLKGKKVGVLGLTFKPNTNDIREAPAFYIIKTLAKRGVDVAVYDPIAMESAKKELSSSVVTRTRAEQVFEQADAVLLITEWKEFLTLPFEKLKETMRLPIIIDGRNALDSSKLKQLGYLYHGIGVK